MKVYVVCFGAYSDRYVAGVFSNRDEANAWARANNDDVDEFDLDPPLDEQAKRHIRPGLSAYSVAMDHDGNGAQVWEQWVDPDESIAANGHRFNTECWASSKEHAIKIANDRRIQWLAGGKRLGKALNYGWRAALV